MTRASRSVIPTTSPLPPHLQQPCHCRRRQHVYHRECAVCVLRQLLPKRERRKRRRKHDVHAWSKDPAGLRGRGGVGEDGEEEVRGEREVRRKRRGNGIRGGGEVHAWKANPTLKSLLEQHVPCAVIEAPASLFEYPGEEGANKGGTQFKKGPSCKQAATYCGFEARGGAVCRLYCRDGAAGTAKAARVDECG
eukprot:93608-Chlamydomonas_euryale.AAC.1